MIRQAYSFNQPLIGMDVAANHGDVAERFSLVSCDKRNIILDTVKMAEADEGMIVRLYESFDMRSIVTVTVAKGFQKAYLCDLMENPLEELSFDGCTVTLPVKNFEILTLKFI